VQKLFYHIFKTLKRLFLKKYEKVFCHGIIISKKDALYIQYNYIHEKKGAKKEDKI